MITIIKNKNDLQEFIDKNGNYNPELTYLSIDKSDECFALFGCTHASEAFSFVDDDFNLVITDVDYETEIDQQVNAANPELNGFVLKDE